jgi:phage shock protein A
MIGCRLPLPAPNRFRLHGQTLYHPSLVDEAFMGIFDRMGRVIQSNLNSLLDKATDDRKLVELNFEELDAQIKAAGQEVVRAVAVEKQLRTRCDDLRTDVERWYKRAELALQVGDEPLAREALKEKQRLTSDLEAAEKARTEQRDAALRMKEGLERMRAKVEDLKLHKGALSGRAAAGAETLGTRGGRSAFEDFRQIEDKIETREAEGAAMAEVEDALGRGPQAADLEARFRALESGSAGAGAQVEADLEALKKRLRV